jgi:Spy/CpxP family protein refolding chaperone
MRPKVSKFVVAAVLSVAATAAFAQTDNSNSRTAPPGSFSNWMNEQSRMNNGYISRDAYMKEAGRRWDLADTNRRGLTADQINSMYDGSAASVTRTPDKVEGNMAPAVKGPTK